VLACAVLAAPQVASATKKTRTVDATVKLAIIESSGNVNQLAGRFTGRPLGTAAVLGKRTLTNTPTGLTVEGPSRLYGKKGTVKLYSTEEVQLQPDGSILFEGSFDVVGGTRKYKRARGGGTLNGSAPPGSTGGVGTVITAEVDGKIRY
jgi:hypothetical protein